GIGEYRSAQRQRNVARRLLQLQRQQRLPCALFVVDLGKLFHVVTGSSLGQQSVRRQQRDVGRHWSRRHERDVGRRQPVGCECHVGRQHLQRLLHDLE